MGIFSAIGHSMRLGRAAFVMAREGAFSGVDSQSLPPSGRFLLAIANLIARKNNQSPHQLAAAFAELGPSYVKLGQFLATRPDVLGKDVVRDLEALQDRVGPFPQETAIKIIETDLERPIELLYTSFGPAVASASIAQVHHGVVTHNGQSQQVAVKVLRPGIERQFRRDLSDMFFAAGIIEVISEHAGRLHPVSVVETLARSVKMEMDFRLEAAAASEFGENVTHDQDFHVPKVDWDRTSKNVLTLEWIDGISLSDHDALRASGHNLPALGRIVIQSFLRHALRDGFFHADMHQGNLFVDRDGRIVAVDFGLMGRLGLKERRYLGEILFGFIRRDYRRVAQIHFEAGYVPSTYQVDDFAQALRAIGEPIHSRTADQISMARLLTLLFEVTSLFDMETRTELVMLQKTMVVVEGVARSLDPHLDMWLTAEPVVSRWIEETLGPVGKLWEFSENFNLFVRSIIEIPVLVQKFENAAISFDTAAEQSMPAAQHAIAKAVKIVAGHQIWIGIVHWILVIILAIIAYKLW